MEPPGTESLFTNVLTGGSRRRGLGGRRVVMVITADVALLHALTLHAIGGLISLATESLVYPYEKEYPALTDPAARDDN